MVVRNWIIKSSPVWSNRLTTLVWNANYAVLLALVHRLSSLCLSNDDRMICAGFEDSGLMVWSLTPEPIALADDFTGFNVSYLSLAGDCEEDIERRWLHHTSALQRRKNLFLWFIFCTFTTLNYCTVFCGPGDRWTVSKWNLKSERDETAIWSHNITSLSFRVA